MAEFDNLRPGARNEVIPIGIKPEMTHMDVSASLSGNLRMYILLHACLYISETPRGSRVAATKKVAGELGFSIRAIYRIRRLYKREGLKGLVRKIRSDAGASHVLGPEVFEFWAKRRGRRRLSIRAEWRSFGSPGSYENFRRWARVAQSRRIAIVA